MRHGDSTRALVRRVVARGRWSASRIADVTTKPVLQGAPRPVRPDHEQCSAQRVVELLAPSKCGRETEACLVFVSRPLGKASVDYCSLDFCCIWRAATRAKSKAPEQTIYILTETARKTSCIRPAPHFHARQSALASQVAVRGVQSQRRNCVNPPKTGHEKVARIDQKTDGFFGCCVRWRTRCALTR